MTLICQDHMTPLVAHGSSVVTPDTAEALRLLGRSRIERGRIKCTGVSQTDSASWKAIEADPGPTGLPPNLSMRGTGREVYLTLQDSKLPRIQELAILWSMAIPLGFRPWLRYPVPGPQEAVFHFLGPWAPLIDHLHGEGRGEQAWPSLCSAAQSEVNRWEGPKPTEVSVQANLHRLGIHCGSVDGVVGARTLNALRSLGLGGLPLTEVHGELVRMKALPTGIGDRRVGYFTMPDSKVEAFASGQVTVGKTTTGFSVTSEGPGRLIFLIGEQ